MTSIHLAIPLMTGKACLTLLFAIIAEGMIEVDYVGGNFKNAL
jgi:hypothetical protein